MKLKNKKTGKIVDRVDITIREEGVVFNNDETYDSLTEMNEEWEDVPEEPKEYWFLSGVGEVVYMKDDGSKFDEDHKFIGNYFETKEEAEKAVEKLKAWKRLKEAGFYFISDAIEEGSKRKFILRLECDKEKIMKPLGECKSLFKDLKLLFGGEE